MQRELFEDFYYNNIEKIAIALVEKNKDCGFSYRSNLDGTYEEYLNQKTALKHLIKNSSDACIYNSGEFKNQNISDLLDGHKVSACITCSIIKTRLIVNQNVNDFDNDNEKFILEKSSRLNEQLALLSGISCLLEFMASNSDTLLLNTHNIKNTKLILPTTDYQDRSNYLDSLTRALYYTNISSAINPLLLSNIYFLLEQYHRLAVRLRKYLAISPNESSKFD